MSTKLSLEQRRQAWHDEIFYWKCSRDPISWARWCAARDLDPKTMPRPLDEPPQSKIKEDRQRTLMHSGKIT